MDDRTPNMPAQDGPRMHDPADTELHSADGTAPYPTPNKTKVGGEPKDDTVDPAYTTPGAPHDRGKTDKDGVYKDALDRQTEKLGGDVEAWKKGRTQN